MKSSFKGYFYGIATSMTFGLIPLFTLPVLGKEVGYESILFHRFLFATLALGLMIIVKGESFRIKPRRELPMLVLLALFYTASSLFLLLGYNYMGAGVATTIHFTYPLMVSFIMFSIFKERTDWIMWTAILLAVAGVAILSLGDGGTLKFEMKGLIIVLLSAVGYASYICGVNKSRLKTMNASSLDFFANCWCDNDDYWDVYFDITERVKDAFDKAGIGIPYPQMDVHVSCAESGGKEKMQS